VKINNETILDYCFSHVLARNKQHALARNITGLGFHYIPISQVIEQQAGGLTTRSSEELTAPAQ
jgi:hypothetical protein